MPTYSFKSVVGAMTDPDVGVFPFAGQEGMKSIHISNATDRTLHDTAADGTIQVTYAAGASAYVDIETQQTSSYHKYLVNWANVKFTSADNANPTNFAGAAIKVIDLINGAIHTLTGVSPLKIPDKTYAAPGGMVTWRLMVANAVQQ